MTLGVLGVIVQNSVSVMGRPVIRPLDSVSVHRERQENTARKVHTNILHKLSQTLLQTSTFIFSLSQCVTAGFMVQAVLSCVSVHTEASVTSAQVTAHVLSPGWDPPVRKVCVGLLSYTLGMKLLKSNNISNIKIWAVDLTS